MWNIIISGWFLNQQSFTVKIFVTYILEEQIIGVAILSPSTKNFKTSRFDTPGYGVWPIVKKFKI
jgi:hypothetical protein